MSIRRWRLRPLRSDRRLTPPAPWRRSMSTGADPDPFRDVAQLLDGISCHMKREAFQAAVTAAVKRRYSLCRFYGPVAQFLSVSDCDPEVICLLYEQLQIGHKVEMYLPAIQQ